MPPDICPDEACAHVRSTNVLTVLMIYQVVLRLGMQIFWHSGPTCWG